MTMKIFPLLKTALRVKWTKWCEILRTEPVMWWPSHRCCLLLAIDIPWFLERKVPWSQNFSCCSLWDHVIPLCHKVIKHPVVLCSHGDVKNGKMHCFEETSLGKILKWYFLFWVYFTAAAEVNRLSSSHVLQNGIICTNPKFIRPLGTWSLGERTSCPPGTFCQIFHGFTKQGHLLQPISLK